MGLIRLNKKNKQLIFPVDQYVKNFFFTYTKNPLTEDNDVWVGYHLGKQNYPLNDLSFFRGYIEEGNGLLEDDSMEYHFINVPTTFEIDEHIDKTIQTIVKGKFKDLGETYFKEAGEILKDEIQINEYDTYLMVKLTTAVQIVNPVEFLQLLKQMLTNGLKNIAGQDSNVSTLLSFYLRKEEQLYGNLMNHKKIRRMTEEDYERITYYQFHRANKTIPDRKLLPEEINEGVISNKNGYVEIEQLDKTHYISSINLVGLPASILGSGAVQNIQDSVSFPIETQIRIRFEHEKRTEQSSTK